MGDPQRHLSPRLRSKIVSLLSVLALALSTAALAEGALQLARFVTPFERVLFPPPLAIDDTRLLKKGNPKFIDHDDYGFRNPKGVTRAQIVAIGDSMTYGTSVLASEAWPRVLERLSGCSVYSMALGGYGPLEYSELAHDSTRLRPHLIIVAIYFGNDFADNWQMYLNNPKKYPVPDDLLHVASELESKSPLGDRVVDFFTMGASRNPEPKVTIMSSARQILAQNSALWGFLRAIKREFVNRPIRVLSRTFETAVSSLTPQQLEYASVFEEKDWRTIFTAGYRFSVEDASDPRIMVGRWLTVWAIDDIKSVAHLNGASVLFVLLPTKESVFAPRVSDRKKHKYLDRLVDDETLHRKYIVDFLTTHNIAYIDASSVLGNLQSQPFFENADGHLNPLGQEVIANSINASIPPCRLGN